MLPRLFAQIFNGAWAMDEAEAEAYYPLIISFLEGNFQNTYGEEFEEGYQTPYLVDQYGQSIKVDSWDVMSGKLDDIPSNSNIVIPIKGAISKYDYCGSAGTQSIGEFIKAADVSQNITGLLYDVDSPGGEAIGTNTLSDIMRNADTPSVSYVEGLAASAGYWIASSANEVFASNELDRIGSIGAFVTAKNIKGWLESKGIKEYTVYSTKSTKKNFAIRELFKEESNEGPIREQIDVINEAFISGIKKNRGSKLTSEEMFDGRIYFAKAALSAGLIDRLGSFEEAVSRLNELKAA